MDQVSRPVQILLAVTLLFAVLWFVALRPKSSTGGESAATPATPAQTTPAPAADPATPAPPARAAEPAARSGAGARSAAAPEQARRPARSGPASLVEAALRQRKAVAIAFVDPRTADARAVAREVRSVSTFGGRAATFAAPLARLSAYDFITRSVEVTVAPTVVIVDPRRRATTIVGFADRGEIEQRLADALAAKPRR
jgi:hypothetical protein